MSLLDRDEVPDDQSRASTSAVSKPRVTASTAVPAPTTPPPMTSTSNSRPSPIAASADPRSVGPSRAVTWPPTCSRRFVHPRSEVLVISADPQGRGALRYRAITIYL